MKYNSQLLHGSIIKDKTSAEFKLSETTYNAGLRISTPSHDFAYFYFVLQGNFNERYKRPTRSCGSFSLIFHPPQEAHSDEFHAATKCFNLQPSDSFLERTVKYSLFAEMPDSFDKGISRQIAAKIYKEFRCTDELSSLIVEGLMFKIFGETLRRSRNNSQANPPIWLNQTLELLHDRFQESIALSEIAGAVGVHETHLAREFKRYYRSTVGEYLRRL